MKLDLKSTPGSNRKSVSAMAPYCTPVIDDEENVHRHHSGRPRSTLRSKSSAKMLHAEKLKSWRVQGGKEKSDQVVIQRNSNILEKLQHFEARFEAECQRSYNLVRASSWSLAISPLEALNLRCANYPLTVRITYGSQVIWTASCPPTAQPTWSPPLGFSLPSADEFSNVQVLSGVSAYDSQRASSNRKLLIDMNNVHVNIEVEVLAEAFPNSFKVAHINIPVLNLLDCISGENKEHDKNKEFERWFPLLVSRQDDPVERDPRLAEYPKQSETRQRVRLLSEPCICLRIQWVPKIESHYEQCKMYVYTQLPLLSASVVNSSQAMELVHVTVSGLNVRGIISTSCSDLSACVTNLQVIDSR